VDVFKNGDDVKTVINKLQSIKADEGEESPGMIEDWDYVSRDACFHEYRISPFHDLQMLS
jgi:hypothetical protein